MDVGKVKLIQQHEKKRKISGIICKAFEVHATFLTMGPSFLMSNFRPNLLLPNSAGTGFHLHANRLPSVPIT